jgi:penicillin-insensitive murein endopeptidase
MRATWRAPAARSNAGRKTAALRAVRAAAAVLAGAPSLGCFGTPSPLAPGLAGSVGWPHHGVQTGAVELPQSGDGFVRYRSQGGHYWGQPALVNGIIQAAQRVQQELPGGAPLVVGDLSAQHGGRIARHQSHRSGRDVDLLWYVTTPGGKPLQNPSFAHLGRDGMARVPGKGYVRLDVARQWLLIKTLLSSEQLEVQWLYSSSVVEALVIRHASAEGEADELIHRASVVMQEPADGLSHDDHMHLRIACSPEARVRGCEGGGPHWSWLGVPPWLDAELPAAEASAGMLAPNGAATSADDVLLLEGGGG